MRVVGVIATSAVGLLALVGVAVGVRSIPDIKRYLQIRSM